MSTTYEKKVGRHYRRIILLVLAALLLIGLFVFVVLFRVTTVKVTGNIHYTDQEIEDMVLTGPLADNTLLASLFKKHVKVDDVAFMDSVDIQMTDRSTLRLDVTEKAVVGCVAYQDAYYYFDKDGIVLEKTATQDSGKAAAGEPATDPASSSQETDTSDGTDPSQDSPMKATDGVGTSDQGAVVQGTEVSDDEAAAANDTVSAVIPVESDDAEDSAAENADTAETAAATEDTAAAVAPEEAVENYVPLVEGLVFGFAVVGEVLPVENTKVFNTINSLTKMINKNNIPPDQVTFDEDSNLTLTYGNNRIALGADENLERKLQELTAILPKLTDLSGVLHLENFDGTQSGIVFDKDVEVTAEDATSEGTAEGDNADSQENAQGDNADSQENAQEDSTDSQSEDTSEEDEDNTGNSEDTSDGGSESE